MEELIAQFGDYIMPIIVTAAATAFTWVGGKIKNAFAKRAYERIFMASGVAVREVAQVYVAKLKAANEDGKITDKEAAEAKRLAKEKTKQYANITWLTNLLLWAVGIKDEFIDGVIESTVHDIKAVEKK